MIVNDDAFSLLVRVVSGLIASRLAPTGERMLACLAFSMPDEPATHEKDRSRLQPHLA